MANTVESHSKTCLCCSSFGAAGLSFFFFFKEQVLGLEKRLENRDSQDESLRTISSGRRTRNQESLKAKGSNRSREAESWWCTPVMDVFCTFFFNSVLPLCIVNCLKLFLSQDPGLYLPSCRSKSVSFTKQDFGTPGDWTSPAALWRPSNMQHCGWHCLKAERDSSTKRGLSLP